LKRPIVTASGSGRLIVVGAGGHGREVCAYIRELSHDEHCPELVGVVDDRRPRGRWGRTSVLGTVADLERLTRVDNGLWLYFAAIGDNRARADCVARVGAVNSAISPWTLRHPRAVISAEAKVGSGTCVAPGAVITSNAVIGQHCIVNVNASVSHDSVVEDFANINPGAVIAGNVVVGRGAYVGAHATVINGVRVGEWAIIGAGAVVIDDLPSGVTAVGVPARVVKSAITT
jgi:acetyltransferase EpsM